MKHLYCWRCGSVVPMLEEDEYSEAHRLYRFIASPENPGNSMAERAIPLIDFHERLTGVRETNPNAIIHHALAFYGPPCENCGKPYRTPQATLCAACGHKRVTDV